METSERPLGIQAHAKLIFIVKIKLLVYCNNIFIIIVAQKSFEMKTFYNIQT